MKKSFKDIMKEQQEAADQFTPQQERITKYILAGITVLVIFSFIGYKMLTAEVKMDNQTMDELIVNYGMYRANCDNWKVPKEQLQRNGVTAQINDLYIIACECRRTRNANPEKVAFSRYNGNLYPIFGNSYQILRVDENTPKPAHTWHLDAYRYIKERKGDPPVVQLNQYYNY